MTGTPGWAWAAAVGVILGLLAIDLAMSRGQPTMRRAVLASAGWVAAAVAFGVILLAWRGGVAGQEYFTAYLVEKALSIDNVFVFALLFQAFAVPAAYQHRVLFAGVLGALVLRAGFIAAGAALLEHLSWAGYAFGALLIATAVLLSARQQRRQAEPAAHSGEPGARPHEPGARPHDLHTGCAGPAPRAGVLESSTRPVATEDEYHQDAVQAADATACPAVSAVAK
jgi:TerC family integral membrane protein